MIRIYILKSLEERLSYFDEMKDSLSQSVLIAQDTAERVKQAATERSNNIIQQAEQDAQRLLEEAKYKANEILPSSTDNAKKVAVETEELKNKSVSSTSVSNLQLRVSWLSLNLQIGKIFFAQQRLIFRQVMRPSKKWSAKS